MSLPRDDDPHATATSGGITTAIFRLATGGRIRFTRWCSCATARCGFTVFHGSLNGVSTRLTLYPATAYGRCSKGRGAGGFNFEYEDWRVAGKGASTSSSSAATSFD